MCNGIDQGIGTQRLQDVRVIRYGIITLRTEYVRIGRISFVLGTLSSS